MEIRILGAHNTESRNTRCTSLIIDDRLALDAGGLTSGLSFRDQMKLQALLLTHQHYDHIRDVPFLAMNHMLRKSSISVYGSDAVYNALTRYLMDGEIYPNFLETPPDNPAVKFSVLEAEKHYPIAGYTVAPVPVSHSVPASGYQITSADGKQMFYTGDTGPGLTETWRKISPQVLFIEVTAPDKYVDFARKSRHMTPGLLKEEMEAFRQINGYLPRIILMHLNPAEEKQIAVEAAEVSRKLGAPIILAHEGMTVHL